MNFEFSDEQRLLRDSVERLLSQKYSFEQRQKYIADDIGYNREVWQEFAESGLLALPFSEADGGIGGGSEELMIVMEALGKVLCVDPYLPAIVLGASLINQLATEDQKVAIVPDIISGEATIAFAHAEADARYEPLYVAMKATRTGTQFILQGSKTLVLHGGSATHFLVTARFSGHARDADHVGVFLVDANTQGITRADYPTQDGMRAAEVTFNNVALSSSALLGGHENALPAISRAIDEGVAALCAEAVGALQAALDITVEYIKTRKQFGRAIGEFQSLQHRAAEMLVEIEQARSMMMYVTMMARHPDALQRSRAVSAAKIQIGHAIRFVGQNAIQLHGGVGMTMEYRIGHYFKRLTMIEKAFGDTDFHVERLGAAGGLHI